METKSTHKTVTVIYAPISDRYWRKGAQATVDTETNRIRLGGAWFDLNDQYEIGYPTDVDTDVDQMETVAENIALSPEEKMRRLKLTKGGTWYGEWLPYCLMCSTMGRMTQTEYGFVCEGKGDHFGRAGCGNMIGWNGKRLQESPLNKSK